MEVSRLQVSRLVRFHCAVHMYEHQNYFETTIFVSGRENLNRLTDISWMTKTSEIKIHACMLISWIPVVTIVVSATNRKHFCTLFCCLKTHFTISTECTDWCSRIPQCAPLSCSDLVGWWIVDGCLLEQQTKEKENVVSFCFIFPCIVSLTIFHSFSASKQLWLS